MTLTLAIDQGTTSSRAILFDGSLRIAGSSQREFDQHFPRSGWVEHDPADLWNTTLATCRDVVTRTGADVSDIVGIGITNQRETTLVWDRKTGKPVYNAIVWQDRRTADLCHELKEAGHEEMVMSRTGLLLDPYFSATKVKWILDNVEGARHRAKAGELAFGTVDSWLIWNLTDGRVHATDATNAARTMLYDLRKMRWSQTMCNLLDIPMSVLPEVRDCAADFGSTRILGRDTPIYGVAGDQQAAAMGQACFTPGMLKSTYGTGCFALLNTGDNAVISQNRLLTTIAYQLDGKPTYALEGSIFIAGAVVQWLRDGLKVISKATDTEDMAHNASETHDLVLVPAFTGLGAPYWNAECRGAIFGLTRGSGPEEFARAALESVGLQTRDLLAAMHADMGDDREATLRVDGGMSASNYAMQFLADIIDAPVDRPHVLETTAMGVAWLVGQRVGLYPDQAGFAESWALERRFSPAMDTATRQRKCAAWKRAVQATLSA